ncbi:hypothetical protein EGW08_007297 [Elysia chlorotica]|uniref:Uncharacterized protein n=1 Tax=Elysia chlorotica TaxID=188477 RepID=A0A433TTP3_ELYCH|nr:hypothetical protein EGW08_007297 [Elysia chlorotica]
MEPSLSIQTVPTLNLFKKPCPDGAGVPSRSSKRKAVDVSTLLDITAKTSWSPFLVISDVEKKVTKLSVFALSKALNGLVGEAKSATELRPAELLLGCSSQAQAKRLGMVETFVNVPVTVKAHLSLNRSKGVVRSPDLETTCEERMVAELDGVTHAKRIFVLKRGRFRTAKANHAAWSADVPAPTKCNNFAAVGQQTRGKDPHLLAQYRSPGAFDRPQVRDHNA